MILAAKGAFGKSYNILYLILVIYIHHVEIEFLHHFFCRFYGSPLWLLNSTAVHSLCLDWRKSLRMLWRVHPITHCEIISGLSNQLPLHINLETRFTTCINKCLSI